MNAIAKPDWSKPTSVAGLSSLMTDDLRTAVNNALPRFLRGHAPRLLRCLLSECSQNPALLDATPMSLFGGVIRAAQLGLAIGGPLGEAFLVPFGSSKKNVKEAVLIVGYRGMIQLAHRSGLLKRISPGIVRDGDHFSYSKGTRNFLMHEEKRNNTEKVTDYYICIDTVSGGHDFETFTFEQAVAHRDRFATVRNASDYVRNKSPWYDMQHGFHQQACKTLIRIISKRMPMSADMSAAVALDEQSESGQPQRLGDVVRDILPPSSGGPGEFPVEDELQGRLDGERPEHVPGVDDPDLDTTDGRK